MLRRRPFRRSTKGSVAIEMALILPILLVLLTSMLFFARIFWFYSAGQKAAHDAARFLATATQAEMRTPGGGFSEARVAGVARWIAQQELQDIVGFTEGILIDVLCDNSACGAAVPRMVHVRVQIVVDDPIFGDVLMTLIGRSGITLTSVVQFPYRPS